MEAPPTCFSLAETSGHVGGGSTQRPLYIDSANSHACLWAESALLRPSNSFLNTEH